jgi:flagellar assembly protein FliH
MSSVIKTDGSSGPALGRGAVPFRLDDVEQKAARYLQQVRQQASQIIAAAHEQAESIREQAARDGRQEALQQAQKQANQHVQQQLQSLLPALGQAVENIAQMRADYLRHWQQQVVKLAVAIAERILRQQLPHRPEVTTKLIQEALELAAGNAHLRLHLNPRDHAVLRQRVPEFAQIVEKLALSDLIADPAVSPGGCIVKTEFGQIDQTVEAQLRRIEEELSAG